VIEDRIMPRRVLFLCTGNYYRSRFAEVVFNTLATRDALDWVAFSRALAIELGGCNVGPISPFAREALQERGIELPEPLASPCQASESDFATADHVIALKEAEHRPYLKARFPDWPDRVEYWHIHDLDEATPAQSMAQIETEVRDLIERFKRDSRFAT
jgi:protein-tyrosine phosphatase